MNKDNAKDFLPLVQALADGKTLEYMYIGSNRWTEVLNLSFTAEPCKYRIKPEPREFWLCKDSGDSDYLAISHKPAYPWAEIIHVVEHM